MKSLLRPEKTPNFQVKLVVQIVFSFASLPVLQPITMHIYVHMMLFVNLLSKNSDHNLMFSLLSHTIHTRCSADAHGCFLSQHPSREELEAMHVQVYRELSNTRLDLTPNVPGTGVAFPQLWIF